MDSSAIRSSPLQFLESGNVVVVSGSFLPHALARTESESPTWHAPVPLAMLQSELEKVSTGSLAITQAKRVSLGELALKEDREQDVLEGSLLLGNRHIAEDADALRSLQVRAVINCAPTQVKSILERPADGDNGQGNKTMEGKECLSQYSGGDNEGQVEYLKLTGLQDGAIYNPVTKEFTHDDIGRFFAPAYEFARRHMSQGRNVFVHCAGGVSRSATIVLSILLRATASRGISLRDTWVWVKWRRPEAGPNATFMNALIDLEEELTSSTSMKRPLNMHQRNYFPR